jgi:hypothetical protein
MTEPTEVTVFRDHLDALTAERDALAATLARLVPLAAEVAKHLEASIASWFFGPGDDHPALRARYDRAMQPVRELRVRELRALLETVP